ncbi:Heat shock protein DnaJ, N-terminal [Penicillium digitatum]|uniref:Heat shock protein DnaJ, N-terminal n=1 Tax=Penicillium digitatum TaxID=36651 RepID=A0A7T6XI75_PENDI|nr:Heat shock protein DnaJ, N-terminal [Penicillium digitatum]
MSSPPDIDPYAVLGVAKEATIPEIRAAYRKRVLKCHPDKVQDESQRIAAQDEFQKVQQAYELLSDDVRRTKYDQKVKIAELKRELLERRRTDPTYNSSRGSGPGNREFRNGHIVEERVPMEVFFEETMRFTDEPRSMSSRSSTEHVLPSERNAGNGQGNTFRPVSDEEASDSSASRYVHMKRTSTTPRREHDSRSRPLDSSHRHERRYDEDGNVADHWQSKFDSQCFNAEDYIARKAQSSKSPRRYHGLDSAEPELSNSRSTGRSTRSRRRSSSRDNSYEHLESTRTFEVKPPKMQPSVTSPGIKASLRPSFLNTRSATTSGFTRPKRESRDSTLHEMAHEPLPSRTSQMRDRNDSGYSSSSTPEMLPKTSTRYKIAKEQDHVVVEPKSSKYRSARSPDRDRVPSTRQTLKRSSTYQTYATEDLPRVETRSARPSPRSHPDVEYVARPKEKDIKYSRTYKPDDVSYSPRRTHYYEEEIRPPAVARRQSAY